ncbi:MAG: urease accessory protein UreD [Egibacteraceae bacterium]
MDPSAPTWSSSPARSGGALAQRVAVERLPPAFARFEHQPEQMPAGAPGKLGLLQLRFEAQDGRTRLASGYASGPQRVGRALHLDPELPGMAFAFIQSVSGGILQGDRLGVEITVAERAQAHVTTQSATKLYRMDRNYATQRLRVRVESGAYLEFLPDYLIPYRNARFYQEVTLEVADDATVVFSDALAPGRTASGETFAYDLLHTRLEARDLFGGLRFTDTLLLEPGRRDPRRTGSLAGRSDLGTLYVLTRAVGSSGLADRLHDCVNAVSGVVGGASRLPGGDGVVARMIGDSSRAVQAALHQAWRTVRTATLGVGVPRIHSVKYGQEPTDPPYERA